MPVKGHPCRLCGNPHCIPSRLKKWDYICSRCHNKLPSRLSNRKEGKRRYYTRPEIREHCKWKLRSRRSRRRLQENAI